MSKNKNIHNLTLGSTLAPTNLPNVLSGTFAQMNIINGPQGIYYSLIFIK